MALSWIINAASAATTAVAKVLSDDDRAANAAAASGDPQRDAEIKALEERLAGLRRERLDNARETLRQTAVALGKSPGSTFGLTAEPFKQALSEQGHASSEYAQTLGAILSIADPAQHGCSLQERNALLSGLRTHELLHWHIEPSHQERAELTAMKQATARMEQLQRLKQALARI